MIRIWIRSLDASVVGNSYEDIFQKMYPQLDAIEKSRHLWGDLSPIDTNKIDMTNAESMYDSLEELGVLIIYVQTQLDDGEKIEE